jgi:hypothetical protein
MCVCVCTHARKCVSYILVEDTLCLLHEDQLLMMFREVVAVCNRNHAKQMHRVSTVQFLSFKADSVC